ncbi:hypothetical protein TSACC_2962 [Terrimicrobium sacchariphilum]|uniref:GLPGLI family protein n=1 Tax=Terrimicrobium sacchariphilum TaxID=690879 RepID=A0A146G566_TERSA|nr:hypothetical protein [Terrimicrobium sacchariphilum]GAT32563.1 hypothetical protein TSACC_2962 [Terrimicrobium sacchariphilum]
MVRPLLIVTLCVAAAILSLHGEDAATTPAPRIPRLPGSFALEKRFTYKAADHSKESQEVQAAAEFLAMFPRPQTVDLEQTGAIRREKVRMTDGSRWEKWRAGQMRFSINEAAPDHVAVYAPGMDLYQAENQGDFEELGWIKEAASAGEAVVGKQKCLVFRLGENVAWLDADTGLPVVFESPTVKVTYTYKEPPAKALELPPRFQKRMEEVQNAWAGRPQ